MGPAGKLAGFKLLSRLGDVALPAPPGGPLRAGGGTGMRREEVRGKPSVAEAMAGSSRLSGLAKGKGGSRRSKVEGRGSKVRGLAKVGQCMVDWKGMNTDGTQGNES